MSHIFKINFKEENIHKRKVSSVLFPLTLVRPYCVLRSYVESQM